jgi:hypothetical protein
MPDNIFISMDNELDKVHTNSTADRTAGSLRRVAFFTKGTRHKSLQCAIFRTAVGRWVKNLINQPSINSERLLDETLDSISAAYR